MHTTLLPFFATYPPSSPSPNAHTCSFCLLVASKRPHHQKICTSLVSGIGAVVKVVDSHPCGWGSIPGNSCSFFIVSLSKGLSLCFMCSDQHEKYWMSSGFPLITTLNYTHTLQLEPYHIKRRSEVPVPSIV